MYCNADKLLIALCALFLGVAVLGSGSAGAEVAVSLFNDAPAGLDRPQNLADADSVHPAIVRQRSVEIHTAALQSLQSLHADTATALSSPSALADVQYQLELFDGLSVTLLNGRVSRGYRNALIWVGEVAGAPFSEAVLVVQGDMMQANISWPGARYHLRYRGTTSANGLLHSIQEIDLSGYPPEHRPGGPAIPPAAAAQLDAPAAGPDSPAADDGSNIDVMVLYTPASLLASNGIDDLTSRINLAVANTNAGYVASGINLTMTLVHVGEANYTEAATDVHDRALEALTFTDDGEIDEIHALRDQYGADLVAMLIEERTSCGLGWIFNSLPDYGFQVSSWDCVGGGNNTLAHEFGHNQGALHDWGLYVWPDDEARTGDAHGYVDTIEGWRTIMAYNDWENCPDHRCGQVNIWSNPDRNYLGDPTGIADGSPRPADNVRVLNDSALAVANFRDSVDPEEPSPPLQLNYVPVVPCRLSNTRADSLGGAFGTGAVRTYSILPGNLDLSVYGGDASGCGIASDAAAVHVNLTVVAPGYAGYLRMWAADQTAPNASVIAWNAGFGASNAVSIPICSSVTSQSGCSGQYKIKIYSDGEVDLVVDVFGYYK